MGFLAGLEEPSHIKIEVKLKVREINQFIKNKKILSQVCNFNICLLPSNFSILITCL